MKFESKAHMAQELIAGKKFKRASGGVVFYNEEKNSPFRYQFSDTDCDVDYKWAYLNEDVWEEVKPRHIHQDLIDSYQEGQAWQRTANNWSNNWIDLKNDDGSCRTPDWTDSCKYHLHPHNELIQAHRNGAKIQAYIVGDWVEEANPDWYEDIKYHIQPSTKIVYEWIHSTSLGMAYGYRTVFLHDDDVESYFGSDHYSYKAKTGRSWEAEV
jgi:hypothetical protein